MLPRLDASKLVASAVQQRAEKRVHDQEPAPSRFRLPGATQHASHLDGIAFTPSYPRPGARLAGSSSATTTSGLAFITTPSDLRDTLERALAGHTQHDDEPTSLAQHS